MSVREVSWDVFLNAAHCQHAKKCVSDMLGTFIPDPISGAAKMQMTQLPDYLQEDVSTSLALPGQKLRAAFTFLPST